MHRLLDVPWPEVVAPEVYRFRELSQLIPEKRYGDWGWYQVQDVMKIINRIAHQFATKGRIKGGFFGVDFTSFLEFLEFQGEYPTWISILSVPAPLGREFEIHDGEGLPERIMQGHTLFIPSGWGGKIIELAKAGVVRMIPTNAEHTTWKAILFDAREIADYQKSKPHVFNPGNRDYLVHILIDLGFITGDQVAEIVSATADGEKDAVAALLEKEVITEEQVLTANGAHFGCEVVAPGKLNIPDDVIAIVPRVIARRYNIVPIMVHGGNLTIAIEDPTRIDVIDSLQHLLKSVHNIEVCIASGIQIRNALDMYYPL
ncbi:MAG: type fimbrial assembly protein [Candidatus Parcubacteria bacterium]